MTLLRASVLADEPAKPAVASTNASSSASATNTITVNPSVTDTNSFSLSATSRASKLGLPEKTILSPSDNLQSVAPTLIVIKRNADSTGLFSGQSGNGSFGFANIEAGFGQAYDNDSIVLRGRNGTAWEETRYVFVKKVIKF